jgi:hypothetical protein
LAPVRTGSSVTECTPDNAETLRYIILKVTALELASREYDQRMAWSEEQKRVGRLELRRRSSTETVRSLRTAFTKAIVMASGSMFLSCLLVWSTAHSWSTRFGAKSAISAIIFAMLTIFASLLAYVRFLDWRRLEKNEGMKTLPQ